MTAKEQFLPQQKRYHPISLPSDFSDEEMARDWTLSVMDISEIAKSPNRFRLFVAIQLCTIRMYGRFLDNVGDLSPRIHNYLNTQLSLPPSMTIQVPSRKATYTAHRANIADYLGFQTFDSAAQHELQVWLELKANQGKLPNELFQQAENYLLARRVLLPGTSVLERLIIHVCSRVHIQIFASIDQQLPPDLRSAIDHLLTVEQGEQRSYFSQLKAYPPAATITSLKAYLARYQAVLETGIDDFHPTVLEPAFSDYLFKMALRYSARDLKRFNEQKRYAMMICFLIETRKVLLDHLVLMHDQYIIDIARQSKNSYEKKHREFRKRQKKAIDFVLDTTDVLLDWPEDKPMSNNDLWHRVDRQKLIESRKDLRAFKQLVERGYGDFLLARYPSLRKYFAQFIHLPFAASQGNENLIEAIETVRKLDGGELKKLDKDAPTTFVPKELIRALFDKEGNLNRNAWETGLALAIKDALRSGDLYLPQSKQHVSFWDLTLSDTRWQDIRDESYTQLNQPLPSEAKAVLTQQFHQATTLAKERFDGDKFASIEDGRLKLKRDDKAALPDSVTKVQKVIDASLPLIRIEQLLMEVDKLTQFSHHFTPIPDHQSRPPHFYRTLMAAIISQATNLGIVSMSASVKGITVDMLRHVLDSFVREETLTAASGEIVNQHNQLPLSAVHGSGTISSSDAQRFRIRASSLLASYYPRYYGYYEKAIGIYTHVSDQYSVFSTKIISCSPREALYVLDGLLENNTILQIRKHTTDTLGYTEIIFALCHLLGFYFMPRIRDLKDQQLYRIDRNTDYGVFTPLLNKTADLDIVIEQWEAMIRVALSLKKRTAPAHVIVQRLTNSFPSDRLSKAFTHLGRIIKTQYILRYLTDERLRRTVQRQLNKGEYRHKLPRRIFFADQGEFTTGDYEEIMNKASCLSLVSNAILYWNTTKISSVIENLRQQGEDIDSQILPHISLLPFKHVIPNGAYFIEDF